MQPCYGVQVDWETEAEVEVSLNHGLRVRRAVVRVYRAGEWYTVIEHTVSIYSPRKRADVVLAFGSLSFALDVADRLLQRIKTGIDGDAVIAEYRSAKK